MSDKTKVLVNFIQDRSGSMQTIWDETLNGFKEFVKELQTKGPAENIDYLFSLTTFDTVIDMPLKAVPIADVTLDALASYGPRGATAIYDAVGKTIDATMQAKDDTITKVVCVIVTDGQENSSREWTKDAIHKAIEAKLNLGNWTFTYLGTQPETWDEASSIGVGAGASANYVGAQASAAYSNVAQAVHTMSRSSAMGSRSLLSRYGNAKSMRGAGMSVNPGSSQRLPIKPPVPAAPEPPKGKGKVNRRWR